MAIIQLDTTVLDALHSFSLIFDVDMSLIHSGPGIEIDKDISTSFNKQATVKLGDQQIAFEYEAICPIAGLQVTLCIQSKFGNWHTNGVFHLLGETSLLFAGVGPFTSWTKDNIQDELNETDQQVSKPNFYKEIVDNMPADIAVFTPDFRFLYINRQAIKDDELRNWLIGKTELDFWKARNRPLDKAYKRLESLKAAIMEQKTSILEETLNAGTPDEKTFVRIITPHFENGTINYLATYGIEITELRRSQETLKDINDELKQLTGELDQFVYSASHNLRAPLMSILGMANLIAPEASAAELTYCSRGIQKSVQLLDETIKDIIEYSQNSRLPVVPQLVELKSLVAEEYDRLQFFNKTNITLIEPEENIIVKTDKKRIAFVVRNILANALKYCDETKEDKYIKVSIQNSNQETTIQISDNGIGIRPEFLPKVYNMFFRGTAKSTGAGLGLFVTRQIITKLGGSISIESTVATGTTVTVSLTDLSD